MKISELIEAYGSKLEKYERLEKHHEKKQEYLIVSCYSCRISEVKQFIENLKEVKL